MFRIVLEATAFVVAAAIIVAFILLLDGVVNAEAQAWCFRVTGAPTEKIAQAAAQQEAIRQQRVAVVPVCQLKNAQELVWECESVRGQCQDNSRVPPSFYAGSPLGGGYGEQEFREYPSGALMYCDRLFGCRRAF